MAWAGSSSAKHSLLDGKYVATGAAAPPLLSSFPPLTSSADPTRLPVILSFWLVIILGLPFWWKTTEVYRAQLPFADIDQWASRQACSLRFPTKFTLHVADPPSPSRLDLASLVSSIQDSVSVQFTSSSWGNCVGFPVSVEAVLWTVDAGRDAQTINDVENPSVTSNGHYDIYVAPGQADAPTRVSVGTWRSVAVLMRNWKQEEIIRTISLLIPSLFAKEQETIKRLVCEQTNDEKANLDSMRTMKYSSRYQMTFSLMNGDPSYLNIDWDIRGAIQTEMSVVSNFTIDSQVRPNTFLPILLPVVLIQHYASLAVKPYYKHRERQPSYYYLDPESLPHFINSAEWNLASAVSSYPTINFILYIPSASETPLRIHNSKGNPISSNAFLIPRWGGIVIRNPPAASIAVHYHRFTRKDLKPIMEIFVSQLRGLLGVHDLRRDGENEVRVPLRLPKAIIAIALPYNITFAPSPQTAMTVMEMDRVVRQRTAENIVTAISTLKSLAQLVSEIPNMVVLDQIQTEVTQALDSLRLSCDALQTGDYASSLAHSIRAVERAERAFFNPTMVSMLYFPDEHKYAIYMPLFVPISVPLIMVLVKEVKEMRQRKKAEKEKVE
ncbi:hypothetical protein BC937DRAFT_93809 [Endogone sp. FLAS-F59071]|nr:hypothetical protein BC937DRAFT_93809 [Endogone sp. FLAS-F59071]|eukprot:RUS21025.1 hypothetical protein BC937DRAFT_93809 [Endogone sp. FLAS-F59071]